MTLYEMEERFIDLEDLLTDPDADQKAVKEELNKIQGEILDKLGGYLKMRGNLLSDIQELNSEIVRLNDRRKMIESRIEGIENALLAAMQLTGKDKLETSLYTVKRKLAPPSVVIDDEALVPKEFWKEKITRTLDKKSLKTDPDVANGKAEYAHLEKKETISIS